MPDAGLRTLFHNNLKSGWHWQSIETGLTSKGVPDSNYCCRGFEGWVEMKQTPEWAVTLKPEQVGWLDRRARNGGRVFVAVRRLCTAGPKRAAADELWLCSGHYARELKDRGLRGCPPAAVLGVWPGGPSAWGWDEVARHLAC